MSRLILVLGCHRSGTSLITSSLRSLGVELGDRLQPPATDNPEGFSEDLDIQATNEALLRILHRSWSMVGPIRWPDNGFPKGIPPEKLLKERLDRFPIFGLKDPRLCRLLPFWKPIFKALGVEVSVVYALRHPLSVAASLTKRNGMLREHGLYLWLVYTLAALLDAEPEWKKVVVDYDLMVEDSEKQLSRIAESLHLYAQRTPFVPREALRHHRDDGYMPGPIEELYDLLHDIARDERPIGYPTHGTLLAMAGELKRWGPVLSLIDKITKGP